MLAPELPGPEYGAQPVPPFEPAAPAGRDDAAAGGYAAATGWDASGWNPAAAVYPDAAPAPAPPGESTSPTVELFHGPSHDAAGPANWAGIEVTEPRPDETGPHPTVESAAHPYFYRRHPGDDGLPPGAP
jgi:hypothetical protein